jgi:hypothetical protein
VRAAAAGGKTVIKSIRVDVALERRLAAICKKMRVTESAYISSMLRRELLVETLSPDFEGITLEGTTFHSVIEMANREALDTLGTEVARRKIRLWLDFLDLQPRRQTVLVFLADIAADCWHWFKIGLNPEGETRLLLYHRLGLNWSLFLESFIIEVFALAPEPPPRISVTETLVKIEWTVGERPGILGAPARTQRESLIIG